MRELPPRAYEVCGAIKVIEKKGSGGGTAETLLVDIEFWKWVVVMATECKCTWGCKRGQLNTSTSVRVYTGSSGALPNPRGGSRGLGA